MEDQWIGHMLESEDVNLSCLINIGLGEVCPDKSRPIFNMVRIPFHEPGDHGFGSEDERDVIGGFEDRIEAAFKKHKGIHAASVRGGGNLDLLYYSSHKAADELPKIAQDICRGYEIEVGSDEDPEWEQFQNLFPSPEAIAEYHDSQLLRVLESEGDRAEKPRPVDHMLFLPDSAAAAKVASLTEKRGFKVTEQHDKKSGELPIGLQLTKVHNIEPDTIAEERSFLTELAEQHGGNYDGWQTPLVK